MKVEDRPLTKIKTGLAGKVKRFVLTINAVVITLALWLLVVMVLSFFLHARSRELLQVERGRFALEGLASGLFERMKGLSDVASQDVGLQNALEQGLRTGDTTASFSNIQRYVDYGQLSTFEFVAPSGAILLSFGYNNRAGKDVKNWPLFMSAQHERSKAFSVIEDRLFANVSAPIYFEGRELGTIIFGVEVDSRVIEQWATHTTSKIALLVNDKPHYSSLQSKHHQELFPSSVSSSPWVENIGGHDFAFASWEVVRQPHSAATFLLAQPLQMAYSDLFQAVLLALAVCIPLVTATAFLVRTLGLRLYEQSKLTETAEFKAATNDAIARTTQALAHDVRKPFSMFNMIIEMVDATDDSQEAKELLKEALPEVKKAITSVDGMLQDVMEVGAESKLICEPTNPESLIEATINEIFRVYPQSNVNITYNFQHTHKVNVDTLKVNRVFSNIVGNAVQAINYRGEIWFKTREVESGKFVEFCLGNDDSFIPAENLVKIFDTFFTSEKKGGTGLGLAIAQKIVHAHGGKIRCESVKTAQFSLGKVEFFFTLPTDTSIADYREIALPESSQALFKKFRFQAKKPTSEQETQIEQAVLRKIKSVQDRAVLLIVDDEAVYRNALSSLITSSKELANKIFICSAKASNEALKLIDLKPFLVIMDVDLGLGSLSGFETVKSMRDRGLVGRVCIHSNRFLVDDYTNAIAAGANVVLPKPMVRAQLFKVMLEALEQRYPVAPVSQALAEPLKSEVVFIDDTELFRMAWKAKLEKETVFHSFDGARSFWQKVEKEPHFLSQLRCVITDFYFADDELETGVELGLKLKKLGFKKPILLASDADFELKDVHGRIDKIIAKDTLTWTQLRSVVESIESEE